MSVCLSSVSWSPLSSIHPPFTRENHAQLPKCQASRHPQPPLSNRGVPTLRCPPLSKGRACVSSCPSFPLFFFLPAPISPLHQTLPIVQGPLSPHLLPKLPPFPTTSEYRLATISFLRICLALRDGTVTLKEAQVWLFSKLHEFPCLPAPLPQRQANAKFRS